MMDESLNTWMSAEILMIFLSIKVWFFLGCTENAEYVEKVLMSFPPLLMSEELLFPSTLHSFT